MFWYLEVLQKYAVFSGRARRKEYWMFQLINVVILTVLCAVIIPPLVTHSQSFLPLFLGVFLCVYVLATILPSLAVSVRRLHDVNFSGWWVLIGFVPAGGVILLVFHVLDSTPGPNQYGPNPKENRRLGYPAHYAPYGAQPMTPSGTQSMTRTAGAGTASPGGQRSLGFCSKCGTLMPAGSTFCPKCGKAAY
jgi:uncharacterized membrane protein YhaH (DUF805 family)